MKYSKKVSTYGVMIALAFIFSYLDTLVPINIGIPGVKPGFANIVVLSALYLYDKKDALIISVIRIVLAGVVFSGTYAMLYSLAGGLLSYLAMIIAVRVKKLSVIGVSVIGAIFHNLGQIIVAAFVTETYRIAYYFPMLIVSAVITGVLIGTLSGIIIKRIYKIHTDRDNI